MKKKNEAVQVDNHSNALFFQRFIAFIIDVMLISMVASFVSVPFIDNASVNKLNESANEIVEKYANQEIGIDTYFSEAMNITYQLARKNGIVSIVTLLLEILYFVVYQFYNDGQTIGKKLMKIKISSENDEELTMNQVIFRSLIINSILVEMIILGFTVFASRGVYFYGVLAFEFIQYLVIIICAFMVMFNKNSRGLHDLIARTKVVRTDAVKELEVCEN